MILAVGGEKRKTVNYLTFSKREDEDIDDFIAKLEKAFTINRVPINKKHIIATSCLKEIAVNFYDELVGITE